MIIKCPNCTVKFAIADSALGEEGRKVRCNSCKHVWTQLPEAPAEEKLESVSSNNDDTFDARSIIGEVSESSNNILQSAKSIPLRLRIAVCISGVSLLFAAYFGNSINMLPGTEFAYSIIGIHKDNGLTIGDVLTSISGDQQKDLMVQWRITNESGEMREIPVTRITLIDEEGKKLLSIKRTSSDQALEDGESIFVESSVADIPDNTKSVILDIGNNMSIASR